MAIAQGLILPMSNAHKSVVLDVPLPSNPAIEYKFAHDRIQQAAYSLIPESERRNVHLQIGKRLLQKASAQQREQNIFDITNQLNLGKELIKIQPERDELAQLNLIAGEKAKASTAYNSALKYFQIGLDLLADNCWQTQYELALALYSLAAETAYLNGELELMEQLVSCVLENTKSLAAKIKVYEVKIQAYAGQMQFLEALAIGLQALEELGLHLPAAPTPEEIQQAFSNTARTLQGRRVEDLFDLPTMTDAVAPLSIRLLANLMAPAYQAAPALFPLIILEMVNLSIKYGNHDLSAFAYAAYSNILGSVLLDIETAYQFVLLALKLLEQSSNLPIRCKTLFMANTSVRFRNVHLKETIKPLQEAYQIGIETGDLEFAAYSILHHCDHCFFTDMPLPELEQKLESYIQVLTQLKESTNANALKVYQQTVLNLITTSATPEVLIGEAYDESQELPLLQQANHHKGLFYLYFNKLFLCYYFENFLQAVDNANQAENYPDGGRSNAVFPIFYFYDSLARLMLYSQVNQKEQAMILQRVADSQQKMQLWAHHAPMNYLHKWYLVEAERHRVLGEVVAAMDGYDRAITLARENEYLQEEALANELAAKFHLANHRLTIAKAYLQEARYGYLRWRATTKVQDLERRYPQLLELRTERTGTRQLDTTQSTSSKLEALDLETVLKASQAIASEILLDKLLAKLMTILIENAGAQTGYLILSTQDEWRVEAMGSIGNKTVAVLQSIPLESISADSIPYLPTALINYVVRTQESIVLDNAAQFGNFQSEPWIVQHQSKSILCAPLLNQGKLTGIVLLENNLTTSAFTPDRIEIFRLLSTQAAISIDNARLLKQEEELNQSLRAEIDERRRAEKDRDRLIAILEASTDHIGMFTPQGNVFWNNIQARKLAGIPLDADITTITIPNYHPQWALEIIQNQGIPAAIQNGSWVGETALLDGDGREIPVSQMIIAHKATDGSLEYFSTIMRDISALKAVEAEVRQLNTELEERVIQRTAQLQSANKALEAFSYSVSHDLRAPLRAIVGFSRMMQEDYGEQLDAEGNRYLKIVRENAKRMGELIDDLLNLSRLDRKEMSRQPVLPNEIIQQVLSDLASDLEGRQIEFAIADLPICQADPSLLKQVWINLLSNAIKYTRYKSPAYIQVGYEVMDGEEVYFIKDNGAGFNMQYADNLFGVFQRLHREQDFAGTGIGLAIVQRIIQRHGGRIWAEAVVNQGATFYFTLQG
ncbi:MAG: ATP-binding protein [Nostoc sp. CmiVER01]|uniref:ATP-binding protein n=1 Tax=Nostoc sp. CmiVER01 TaxID=3075384 RepID=UPI002AD46C54|nr:ATP-binding protein [Nostoc sp. CmiVER01]MDZ8125141.1 ATP-binding protein [Nostoc sp. CmiVER01]